MTMTRHHSPHRAFSLAFLALATAFGGILGSKVHAALFVADSSGDRIGTYVAKTGEPIHANLVPGPLGFPYGIAFRRNEFYVTDALNDRIGLFNATTGVAINPNFITQATFPSGIARRLNTLYVAFDDGLRTYDATSGAVINPRFIQGLSIGTQGTGIAFADNQLFITENGKSRVGSYSAVNGVAINSALVTGLNGPRGVAILGNVLYVSDDNGIGTYSASTGAAINAALVTGLSSPAGIVISDGTLYVADSGNNRIGAYNASTGAAINPNLVTGVSFPRGLAIYDPGAITAKEAKCEKLRKNLNRLKKELRKEKKKLKNAKSDYAKSVAMKKFRKAEKLLKKGKNEYNRCKVELNVLLA